MCKCQFKSIRMPLIQIQNMDSIRTTQHCFSLIVKHAMSIYIFFFLVCAWQCGRLTWSRDWTELRTWIKQMWTDLFTECFLIGPFATSHDNVHEHTNVVIHRFTHTFTLWQTNTISIHICVMPFWQFYSLHKHVAKTIFWDSIWVSICAVNKRLALDSFPVPLNVIGGEGCCFFTLQK